MKINQIVQETTTAGSVAPVEYGFVKMETRNPGVYGNTKAGSLFKGKKTKAPYANSINEGAMKQLSMDLKAGADGLSDQEFQKKYKMTKQEARKELTSNRKENNKPQPVSEAHLEEDDIILVPGQGRKMKTGFVPHGQSRVDHEVEMARSDLFSAAQNAQKVYSMIKDISEEEGLEGWVQEKIIKANDYLNTIREYLEGKQVQGVAEGAENILPRGTSVTVLHKGKKVPGKIVRYDAGKGGYSNAYVVDIGEYESILVPASKIQQQGVAEDMNVFEDDQVRPQGRILKSLRDMAIASPTSTFQNFRQAGKESIITDAIMAAKVLKRYYQQKGNQTAVQFLYNLENELDDFRRGYNSSTDNLDLSDLSRGTLGKMQFQTNGGGGGATYGGGTPGTGGSGGGGAGKAIQSLKNLAVMKSALTMQQLTQAGREAIVSNAINAAKTLEQSYLQNKQQGNAIFVRALRDEIDNFMRGAPINASFPETDTASELGELLQGKLGKVNFQQGVAEGTKVDRMVKHITKSEKKLGKSKDEAENIAWATANKRGMLDNKNKKAK